MELPELRDLAISAIVLAIVFSYQGIGNLPSFLTLLPISLIIVSSSFILHELAHRTLARKYGCYSRYHAWPIGLALAVILTIISNGNFVFAAPGAVVIYPRADLWGRIKHLTRKEYGLISVAGPVINIALGLAFIAAYFAFHIQFLLLGAAINAWLAVFNLIPFPPLDGIKICVWNRIIWLIMILAGIGLLAASQII